MSRKSIKHEAIEKESLLSDNDILDIVLEKEQEMLEATEECFDGLINPVIVKGPPGTGKSEGIDILAKQMKIKSTDLISTHWEKPDDDMPTYPYVNGPIVTVDGALMRGADYEPWSLAVDLYGNRDSGALVFDDNDDILKDTIAVAMIMDATEQKASRPISYPKANTTHELKMRGVQPTFEVNTPIIILSNIDMKLHVDWAKQKEDEGGKPGPGYLKRWAALMSRGTYVDLDMNTPRSTRVFCENKVRKTKMLMQSSYLDEVYGRCLTKQEQDDCMKWIRFNQASLKLPLDLRTYNKVAGMMIKRGSTWEKSAKARMLKVL